jgi:hypothetical protein
MSAHLATTIIWISSLALPCLLFLAANSFRNGWQSILWAALSTAVGWLLALAYAVAAHSLALTSASPTEHPAVFANDGAPLAFAAVLGWVPAAVAVILTWGARSAIARWRSRKHGL